MYFDHERYIITLFVTSSFIYFFIILSRTLYIPELSIIKNNEIKDKNKNIKERR